MLKWKTLKNDGDFYCLDSLHYFKTKNKRESHKQVYENKYFSNNVMPSEGDQKYDIAPFIIYADLECLIEKIDRRKINPKILSTLKLEEQIA